MARKRKHRISNRMRRIITRHRACLYARFLEAHASQMPYQMFRPMRSFLTPWMKVPSKPTDCSESASMILHAAGAPTPYVTQTPTGGWEGFTGTMLATLEHVEFSQTRRADFAVFVNAEHPEGEHVVILLQGGRRFRDPLVWSHGHNGVDVMPLSEMKAGFRGYNVVYLRTVPEKYTKAEKTVATSGSK